MKNNFVTWDALSCPPVELKCILEKLICEYQCAPNTTFTGSFASGVLTLTVNGISAAIALPDLDNQTISLAGNILSISGGNNVDLTPFANLAETVTTITGTVAGNPIATYTDEAGVTTVINETITSIVDNGDGTATYVNEAGASVTFPIGSATLVNNGDGTYTFTAADGSVVTISDTSLSTLVDNGDNSFTFTNESGVATTFTVAADIVTTITNTVFGNKIADFTDELGGITSINETITTIVNNGDGTATFTNEAGTFITFPIGAVTAVDNGDGTYTLTFADGSTVTISDTSVSPLVVNSNGTLTYTDETGVATTFALGDTIIDNGNGTYTVTKPDGSIVTIVDVVSTMVNNGDGTFTYTDESGAITTFLAGTAEIITNVFDINSSTFKQDIARYENEAGASQFIKESIIKVTPFGSGWTITNEANELSVVQFNVVGTNLEISASSSGGPGVVVATIPLTLNEIEIDNAGSNFDLTDDVLSFVETNGDTATINFSKYNISATLNPDGTIGIFQNGNLITTIPVPCCVLVNKIPLTVVVDSNAVQTTNLNSIVTDSAGDVFFIDGVGNAQKVTTDFSLTVNAGTTNVATDDSLGTATVGNGGVIHFWSSDGSIQFGVVQGSAETGITTNSNIIPFTPSLAVGDDAGIAATTVQGAIDEVDGKVEILEDQPQIFAKVGGVQTTNNIGHTEAEVAVRTGAVVIGATTAPTTAITKLDVTNGDIDIDKTIATTGAVTKNGVLWEHNFGLQNTYLGEDAGNRTSGGQYSVGVGYNSLKAITTGFSNTAVGLNSLPKNTTGFENTSLGTNTLFENIGGQYNTAVGVRALNKNLSNFNTAVGTNALRDNTTANENTAVGYDSLVLSTTAGGNTSVGYKSMERNTTGFSNVSVGRFSARNNTTGLYNTNLGNQNFTNNTTGSYNVSVGYLSLSSNIAASNNVGVGFRAGYSNVSGTKNSSFGDFAYVYNTINSQNTALGSNSFNGFTTLATGVVVTAISTTQATLSVPLVGAVANDLIFALAQPPFADSMSFYEGVYKVINSTTIEVVNTLHVFNVGGTYDSIIFRKANDINNSTAVGYNSEPTLSNQVMLGNLAVTEVRTAGAYFGTAFNIVSDKKNKYIGDVVATKTLFGEKIDIYEYQLISDGSWHLGAIAQDVQAIEAKRGRFILTSKSYGLNYGATIEQFNSILGTSYKFYSEINEQEIKNKIVEAQGIKLKEAEKVLETRELVERLKLEVDENGNSTYKGEHDKYLAKYLGFDLTGDETFRKYHVFEEDMLSLSTAINTVLV